jgi:hypothetical protein
LYPAKPPTVVARATPSTVPVSIDLFITLPDFKVIRFAQRLAPWDSHSTAVSGENYRNQKGIVRKKLVQRPPTTPTASSRIYSLKAASLATAKLWHIASRLQAVTVICRS